MKNSYEKRYGIKENKETKKFHKSRRMFAIKDGVLHIAKPNLPYSHAIWFEKKNWISKENDKIMEKLVRGFVDSDKNVHFYVGYDFDINKEAQDLFFQFLLELVTKLKIPPISIIFGGRKKIGKKFVPIKKYGQVKDYLWL